MATTLVTIRAKVRTTLKDGSSALWTDEDLDRAIERAMREYSRARPRQQVDQVTLTSGSREVSLAALTGLIEVETVEWPIGQWPPQYVRFGVWDKTLTLLVETPPAAGALEAKVYWHGLQTLDDQGSSIPTEDEELIVSGAAGYAALEWAVYAINRLNSGGSDVAQAYREFGELLLGEFRSALAKSPGKSKVRVRSLYTPATRNTSEE